MAASTRYLVKGNNILVVNVQGVFSAADEVDTIVIDKSTLAGPLSANGTSVEASSICIDEITWAVGLGFDYVLLEWEHTADDAVDYFQGQGYMNYREYGGKDDPKSAGGTGDLILTTSGGAAGDSYSFLIKARLKGD